MKNDTTKCLTIKDTPFVMEETPITETEKAFQFRVINSNCGSNKVYWIPKSLLKKEINEKNVTLFTLPAWFLNKTFGYIS